MCLLCAQHNALERMIKEAEIRKVGKGAAGVLVQPVNRREKEFFFQPQIMGCKKGYFKLPDPVKPNDTGVNYFTLVSNMFGEMILYGVDTGTFPPALSTKATGLKGGIIRKLEMTGIPDSYVLLAFAGGTEDQNLDISKYGWRTFLSTLEEKPVESKIRQKSFKEVYEGD